MKRKLSPPIALLVAICLCNTEIFAGAASHDHSHDHSHGHDHQCPSHVHSLDITVRPGLDGMVEVEKKFRLEVDGVSIKRGPVLNYLTVFPSKGGLILDAGMEILEVSRNGKPETARLSNSNGTTTLLIGREDRILKPGPHDYIVRYRRLGSWVRQSEELTDSFDVTEAFRPFTIDRLSAKLVLPEGTKFTRRSASVLGTTEEGPGYRTTTDDRVLFVETTAPLAADHSVFLNSAWSADGFSSKNRWTQLLLQHPKIPMAAIGCGVACLALWVLLAGGHRRAKERRMATAAG